MGSVDTWRWSGGVGVGGGIFGGLEMPVSPGARLFFFGFMVFECRIIFCRIFPDFPEFVIFKILCIR